MKWNLVLVLSISIIFLVRESTYSQQGKVIENKRNLPLKVDVMPQFDGHLNNFISRNLTYPNLSNDSVPDCATVLEFVVEESGKITGAEIVKSSGVKLVDAECLRVIKLMPNWKPARLHGNAVAFFMRFPIMLEFR